MPLSAEDLKDPFDMNDEYGEVYQPEPYETPKGKQYKVKKGDSLYIVAKRFNVEMQHLKRWNPRTGQALKPGQMLVVSGPR